MPPIVQQPGGPHYEALSNAGGHYRIANPATGTYTVRAEQNGFRTATTQITVVGGQTAKADFHLTIAGRSENVLVTDTAIINVFGDKSDIPIEEFPQSIQVINQEAILNMNAVAVGDILTAVSSATAGPPRESTYQRFAFRVRGFTA